MKTLSCWLLLFSWPLWSSSLYTHWPDSTWQDLFSLSALQHQQLAAHLQLSEAETQAWLNELQQALGSASCQSEAKAVEVMLNDEMLIVSNQRGLLQLDTAAGERWWYLPWFLLPQMPEPQQGAVSAVLYSEQKLMVHYPGGLYALSTQTNQLQPLWHYPHSGSALLLAQQQGVWLSVQQQLLRLDPQTGAVLSQWQFTQPVVWAGEAQESVVLLATVDHQIWRIAADTALNASPELIADLKQLAPYAVQQIQIVDAMVPLQPAGGMHWRRAQPLLLLSADKGSGSLLLMLRLGRAGQHNPILVQQQHDSLSQDAEYQQLLDADGWYSEFAGPLYAAFTLAAGVWYQQLELNAGAGCAAKPSAVMLLALHLHYGTAVYTSRALATEQVATQLSPGLSSAGFTLQDAKSGLVVLPELLEIKAQCARCASPLLREHFPRQKLLAVYQTEHGGQE